MKNIHPLTRRAALVLMITVPFAPSASAQTTTPPVTATKKPTSATPQMIEEAIQRSQARTRKEQTLRIPEQFGSEEPFTYVPGRTN
jgi:predicted outer membrane protein